MANAPLTHAQVALARHHSYALFSQLFLEGITPALMPAIQAVPELAAALPVSFNFDEAAAEYHHLFSFNLFPYESIFLGTDGLLGGPVTNRVLASYRQMGYEANPAASSPDHISCQLDALAFLCLAEADAWEDGLPVVALRMRGLQQTFLQEHLLRWLLPFVLAVQQQERPFYSALANLTLKFVAAHAITGGPHDTHIPPLPDPPSLLDDEQTGLRDIAAYLTTPPYSGLYLGRDDVGRLARQLDLPRGFGGRHQLMLNALRTAVQYDSFSRLISKLRDLFTDWDAGYDRYSVDFLVLAPFARAWQAHVHKSLRMLDRLDAQTEFLQ